MSFGAFVPLFLKGPFHLSIAQRQRGIAKKTPASFPHLPYLPEIQLNIALSVMVSSVLSANGPIFALAGTLPLRPGFLKMQGNLHNYCSYNGLPAVRL